MRMALVEVIGSLIRELSSSDDMTNDSTQTHKQLSGLFDLLISRTLDLSSYVRSKVLATFSKLCDLRIPFPKQRLMITRQAAAMLEDKASTVRKSAVALLTKLVWTHPWGLMHGGPLNLEKWQGYYEEVKAKLDKLEDAVGKAVERDKAGEESKQDGEDGNEEDKEEGDVSEDDEMQVDDAENAPRALAAMTSEQEALAALESNEALHLRLRKKYYSEALNFIRTIESAMEPVMQLLGSTNKAEVLESMEFFRVTKEYEFESAEVALYYP